MLDFLYSINNVISVVMRLKVDGAKLVKADTLGSSGSGNGWQECLTESSKYIASSKRTFVGKQVCMHHSRQ